MLGIGIAAFFASNRGRKSVTNKVVHTQENLKYAKELVDLFKKQHAANRKNK